MFVCKQREECIWLCLRINPSFGWLVFFTKKLIKEGQTLCSIKLFAIVSIDKSWCFEKMCGLLRSYCLSFAGGG